MSIENISPGSSKVWIKYVIGAVLFLVGIGMLFFKETATFAPIIVGISVGKII